MTQCSLCLLIRENNNNKEILLAMKKRGFGINKWNGTGGKFKDDKDIIEVAIRETEEEIGVKIKNPEPVAILSFYFPHKPEYNQDVHVFLVREWEGEIKESEEMLPQWFKVEKIPYDKMWDDDQYWLPKVLAGKNFKAKFIFSPEEKVISKSFEFVNKI